MKNYAVHLRAFAFGTCVALLAFSDWANADPPSRLSRFGYATGAFSFSESPSGLQVCEIRLAAKQDS